MDATITLDVIGTNLAGTTFNIYQDADLYATPVASNISDTTLASGYAVTLDGNTNTIRVLSNGSCGNFKDIPVNRGDTSPSVVQQYSGGPSNGSITGNGKSEIFAYNCYTLWFSTDNGDTFTSYAFSSNSISLLNPQVCSIDFLHDGTNLYVFFMGDGDDTIHVYRVTNYNTANGFDDAVYTEVLSQTMTSGFGITKPYFINNAYYITTYNDNSLYRTEDLSVDFVQVLSPAAGYVSGLDNYGKTIFCTVDYEFAGLSNANGVYKSVDNGLNWSQLSSQINVVAIDVESESKHIITIEDTSSPYVCFAFTEDGGSTYTNVTISGANGTLAGCFVKKYKSVYFYVARSFSTTYTLQYIPDIYAPSPLGNVTVGGSSMNVTQVGGTAFLQRNSLLFSNASGFYSYIITDTI